MKSKTSLAMVLLVVMLSATWVQPLFASPSSRTLHSAYTENIAYNPTSVGYPSPLESDNGWGGGAYPWDMLDGNTYYTDTWAHGLAFTGGFPGWFQPCGWRQATVAFGEAKAFDMVRVWHHGDEHLPSTYYLEYWDGSSWLPIEATSTVRWDLAVPPPGVYGWGATPTEHTFARVVGSKVRFVLNNCDIQHGWIYEFEVFGGPPSIAVSVDIKPGDGNSVNPNSKGVTPVALLTTEQFDATSVDPLSVRFGPDGAIEAHSRGHLTDVDGDGDSDLMLHFRTQDTGIACGATSASLTGLTFDGQAIEGTDAIITVGC